MDEYKSRLSAYLSDMVREELEKYDGGFTDEWNDQRKKNAEVLGYKLSGKSDIKEGATEFWQDMFRPGNIPNKYINQLIKKKGELPSKSHIKSIYKDNGNPSSSQLSKAFKQLAKEKYIKKQGSLWKWESGFAWRTGTELESVNEELQNSQGEQTDFKKGDMVKDINPDCPHVGSEGEVTKVGNGTITFKVTNNGKNYQEGDELEKTVDQMVKLKESVNELKQSISGNKMFMKRTILPITKKAGIKKVNIKELPAQYDDDKDKIEITFDVDKETNDNFLDLLKKKAGKKGTKKRKNFNLTVQKEGLGDDILKNLKKYKKAAEKNQAALDAARKRLKKKESVKEAKETAIDIARRVVKNKQHEKGLDLTTANFIVKIYDAYKDHPNLQKQMDKMPLPKMVKLVYKVMK